MSGKMTLKLDDDVLGCRAGQVVDLDERREVANCLQSVKRQVPLHVVQRTLLQIMQRFRR